MNSKVSMVEDTVVADMAKYKVMELHSMQVVTDSRGSFLLPPTDMLFQVTMFQVVHLQCSSGAIQEAYLCY